MVEVLVTVYAVRRKPCGCLVSSNPAKDQSAALGQQVKHPNGDVTTAMPLDQAAKVPERCRQHEGSGEVKGQLLWGDMTD
jgi:hypothetical protein